MTDIEFEKRLADAEHSIDRLYTHVLVLSIAAAIFILLFFRSVV